MARNLKLATPAPPRSEHREALAAAIARRHAAEQRVANVRAAEEKRSAAYSAASGSEEAAREAVAAARANEGRRLAAEFLVGDDAAGPSLREAKVDLERLKEEVARLDSARDVLAQELQAAERELDFARRAVVLRVREAVRSEHSATRLLDAAEQLQAALTAQRLVLRHLLSEGLVPEQEEKSVVAFLRNYVLPNAPPYGGLSSEFQDWSGHPAAASWRRCAEALALDADAALPE